MEIKKRYVVLSFLACAFFAAKHEVFGSAIAVQTKAVQVQVENRVSTIEEGIGAYLDLLQDGLAASNEICSIRKNLAKREEMLKESVAPVFPQGAPNVKEFQKKTP